MLSLVRACYGATLVLAPGAVVRVYSGHPARPLDTAVTRVLGARHVVQAAACARSPGATALLLGAATDVAHALSELGLATFDRPRRRAGLVDALVACCFAAASVRAATFRTNSGSAS